MKFRTFIASLSIGTVVLVLCRILGERFEVPWLITLSSPIGIAAGSIPVILWKITRAHRSAIEPQTPPPAPVAGGHSLETGVYERAFAWSVVSITCTYPIALAFEWPSWCLGAVILGLLTACYWLACFRHRGLTHVPTTA